MSLKPPIEPMLAKRATSVPTGDGWLFEPKWDGFRTLVFRDGDEIYLQSRTKKPLLRYFPEIAEPLRASLPDRCVLDGELVVARNGVLDFGLLQMRLHPAKSRVDKLAAEIPTSYVAFDVLGLGEESLMEAPQEARREQLVELLADAAAPIHLTPATRDRHEAVEWFQRFEGAGLDGVMAKRLDAPYVPKKRTMVKVKHVRTADCVVAGFRWHKNGPGTHVGSLLLGLYDGQGDLQHVGVTSSFKMERRKELVAELEPLVAKNLDEHPWGAWSDRSGRAFQSRWSVGKDLSFVPLRIERVAEVKFDHLEGHRFRHAATFVRWRLDKEPRDCDYHQISITPPYDLADIFGAG